MTATMLFTAHTVATVPRQDDAADLLNEIGDALEHDARALGAGGVSYDYATDRVSSIFQVDADTLLDAQARATSVFDVAVGDTGHMWGVTVIEGDDPDLLP